MLVLKVIFILFLMGYIFLASMLWGEIVKLDSFNALPLPSRIFWYVASPIAVMIFLIISQTCPHVLADFFAFMERKSRDNKND